MATRIRNKKLSLDNEPSEAHSAIDKQLFAVGEAFTQYGKQYGAWGHNHKVWRCLIGLHEALDKREGIPNRDERFVLEHETEYCGVNPNGSKFPVYFDSDEELKSRITEVNDNRQ